MICTTPDGVTFPLLQPTELTLTTQMRIQAATGYGPVKMGAALAAMVAIQQAVGELDSEATGAAAAAALETLAAEGDVDVLAIACLVWGSRIQAGEREITLDAAADFALDSATWELTDEERRAQERQAAEQAATEAAGVRPTSTPARSRGNGHSAARPRLPARST